jgi:hypothetical protein
MRWHLSCFGGAKTDSTNNEAIPAPGDPAFNRVSTTEYLAPADLEVFAMYAGNDTITRARLVTPSLRTLGLPEIYPLNVTAAPALPLAVDFRPNDPVRIKMNDTFSVEASNGASTVDTAFAALAIRKQFWPVPAGSRTTLSGTAAQTLVANGFSFGTITFDQTPPVGNYSVIGMSCVCASAWFARLIFPMQSNWRPGVIVGATAAAFEYRQAFRHGNVGEWGRFHSVNLPQLEIFGNTAGAQTPRVYIDVVQIDAIGGNMSQ